MRKRNDKIYYTRLSTMIALLRQQERPPSIREIQQIVGICADSAMSLTSRMVKEGYLNKGQPGKYRTLHLTSKGKQTAPLVKLAKRREDGGWEMGEGMRKIIKTQFDQSKRVTIPLANSYGGIKLAQTKDGKCFLGLENYDGTRLVEISKRFYDAFVAEFTGKPVDEDDLGGDYIIKDEL